jgi:muramoyltetrapeptide carboxypeptidase LdcA involved in peptidoglycan recycling
VEFLQLVGITDADLKVLEADESRAAELVEMMKADDPDMVIDFSRAKSYLF